MVAGTLVAILVLVGIIMFARMGFNERQGSQNGTQDTQQTIEEKNTTNQKDTTMDTEQSKSGFSIKTIKEGAGEGAKTGDQVTVNYTGTLTDGTVFDSNVDPKFGHVQPFTFSLGTGMVIKGWDMGVLGMKKGEKRHLVIPSDMAYGDRAIGVIPANATLEFDVEVIGIN